MNSQNERCRGFPSLSVSLVVHFFPFLSKRHSPQSFSIIFGFSSLNIGPQISAQVSSVKAHCWYPDPKTHEPFIGQIWMSPMMSSSAFWLMITLIDSITCLKSCYITSLSFFISMKGLSILFIMRIGLMRSFKAWRNTVSVCTHTFSTQSTTTTAPSVTRRAAVTSEEKSTCPGESIKLINKSWLLCF